MSSGESSRPRDGGIAGAEARRPSPQGSIDRQAREAALRIMASTRMGERNRIGLLLYLEGVSARKAARIVGFDDHTHLWRRARAHGLGRIHANRRPGLVGNRADDGQL